MRASEGRRTGVIAGIARGLCPRCRIGSIFRSFLGIHAACPVCGLRFAREAGYFLAAMYFSYAMAVPLLAGLTLAVHLVVGTAFEWSVAVAALLFLPLAPVIFRTSRIIWIYVDQAIDPQAGSAR